MNLEKIRQLLDTPLEVPEEEREEDLQIIQPDGSRACISYELAGRGYSLVKDLGMDAYVDMRRFE